MAIEQSGSGGFGKWQGGPMFFKMKKFGNGQQNSGAAGRSKTRKFNIMRRELADAAKKYSVVLACNDQYRSQGTGISAKAQQTVGSDFRPRALAELLDYCRAETI